MAIDRIQNQTAFTQRPNVAQHSANVNMERLVYLPRKHYKNHNEIPNSVNMIKPEPGQGHLLNGGLFGSIGRFFSNRIYDIKSVYRGYKGTANDHQLGRTNDVGLVLGGLGIASFLTTKRIATMPKHMEFIGLASFLASMALWPKIGIFGPARLVHGFDGCGILLLFDVINCNDDVGDIVFIASLQGYFGIFGGFVNATFGGKNNVNSAD